jgi:hypothetical protein
MKGEAVKGYSENPSATTRAMRALRSPVWPRFGLETEIADRLSGENGISHPGVRDRDGAVDGWSGNVTGPLPPPAAGGLGIRSFES